MVEKTPPRIYCLIATEAPVAAVFRRGPSKWSHVGRWDLESGIYEPGAWFRGRIFPRRSDVSPDGRYICYFAHKPTADWDLGEAYVAVSRLPWLTALHAFKTCGTWTRGFYFTADGTYDDKDEEDRLPVSYGLRSISVVQFANERRRGWMEATDSPARREGDLWDQDRNARLRKKQPGGDLVLCVESVGWAGGEFGKEQAVDGMRVSYSLETTGDIRLLDDLQWADWDRQGRLVAATRDGRLQITDPGQVGGEPLFEEDLSALEPEPVAPPDWAKEWGSEDH
jgi:hypothetical protein